MHVTRDTSHCATAAAVLLYVNPYDMTSWRRVPKKQTVAVKQSKMLHITQLPYFESMRLCSGICDSKSKTKMRG